MLERPDAADLLATAREALLRRLLPALPPELHYEARMVANAMAIAARAGVAAPVAGEGAAEMEALARRLRRDPPAPGTEEYAAIRAGLEALTRRRCAVSAPRAAPG